MPIEFLNAWESLKYMQVFSITYNKTQRQKCVRLNTNKNIGNYHIMILMYAIQK